MKNSFFLQAIWKFQHKNMIFILYLYVSVRFVYKQVPLFHFSNQTYSGIGKRPKTTEGKDFPWCTVSVKVYSLIDSYWMANP
jgi:hypothetical protein